MNFTIGNFISQQEKIDEEILKSRLDGSAKDALGALNRLHLLDKISYTFNVPKTFVDPQSFETIEGFQSSWKVEIGELAER